MQDLPLKKARAVLSKSTFIRGIQCEKSLYLHKKRPFLRDPLSPEKKAVFSRGTKVGEFARQLFPGGVNAAPKSHFQMAASAVKTAEYIASGETIIYEAAFEYNGVIIALDILIKDNDGWKAIEVKSSRGISETYIWDAALQYHVITGNGITLKDFSIAHINEAYVKMGELEPSKLFLTQSVLEQVKEKDAIVTEKIALFKEVINLKSSPAINLGLQCRKPYDCDFQGHCWKKVPEGSVFQLKGISDEKKFEYYNNGISKASEIPEVDLNKDVLLQQQVKSISENIITGNKEKLIIFLEKIKRHVTFFSILCHRNALPPFDGVSPYECLPFSLGLSFPAAVNKDPLCFVASPDAPMNEELVGQLLAALPAEGSILTFDARQQMEMLQRFASKNPILKKEIEDIESRMIDLQIPFTDNSVIWPNMLQNTSPEAILKSMKKRSRATTLEATLHYQQLMVSEFSASGGATIESYHKELLQNLAGLWEVLNEASQATGI